jgi:hypothetical protein
MPLMASATESDDAGLVEEARVRASKVPKRRESAATLGTAAAFAAAAAAVLAGLRLDWGKGLDPAATARQAAGLTVAVTDPSAGWRYAHWLVAHARDTGLERVRFADLEWYASAGKWQQVTGDRAAGDRTVVAEVFE